MELFRDFYHVMKSEMSAVLEMGNWINMTEINFVFVISLRPHMYILLKLIDVTEWFLHH
jgi:hypothetical protein